MSILHDCAALRAEAKETLAWGGSRCCSTHGSVARQGGDVKHEMPSGLTCIFWTTEYHELDFLSAGRDLAGGAGTAEDG